MAGGGGRQPGQRQRAESAWTNEAKRRFMTVTRLLPATDQGTCRRTMVYGTVRGQQVREGCRTLFREAGAALVNSVARIHHASVKRTAYDLPFLDGSVTTTLLRAYVAAMPKCQESDSSAEGKRE